MTSLLDRLAKKTYVGSVQRDWDVKPMEVKSSDGEQMGDSDLYRLFGIQTNGWVGMAPHSIPDSAIRYGQQFIDGTLTVSGSINTGSINIGDRSFVSSVAFTTSFADEVSWTNGSLRFIDGTVVTVNAGTTGRLQRLGSPFSAESSTLALWHMDESSGSTLDNAETDASWDGTATGTSVTNATESSSFSNGRFLNGVSDFITISDYSEMDQSTFSIEGWFKTGSVVTATQYIASRSVTGASATARYFDVLITDTGYLQGTVYGYDGTTYYPYNTLSNAPVDDSLWHHFTLSFDASADTLSLYVDGILTNVRPSCIYNPNVSAQAMYFGKSDLATPGYFNGTLDEFRFSNSAVTYSAAAKRFIYYDSSVGPTLQVTADRDSAISGNRVLLAIVEPQISGGGAAMQLINREGTTITGTRVTTGRVESSDGLTYLDLDTERRLVFKDDNGIPKAFFGLAG